MTNKKTNTEKRNPVGRPRAYPTVESMREKTQEYFDLWEEKGRPLTMAGLLSYLDVCEDTFREYSSGNYDCNENDFSGTIKKIRKHVEASKLEQALLGNYNASVSIFDLKNNHGYSDKSEVKTIDMTPTVIHDDIPD